MTTVNPEPQAPQPWDRQQNVGLTGRHRTDKSGDRSEAGTLRLSALLENPNGLEHHEMLLLF